MYDASQSHIWLAFNGQWVSICVALCSVFHLFVECYSSSLIQFHFYCRECYLNLKTELVDEAVHHAWR